VDARGGKMTLKNGLSIIIASYLECENLKNIIPQIKSSLDGKGIDYEIIIVDTVEPMDKTPDVVKEFGAVYVNREGGNDYGCAIRSGIKTAGYSRILNMDADGSHAPADVLRLYEKSQEGYDIVIGSRYASGGKTDNGWWLRFLSRTLNVIYAFVFGLKVKDVSTSFRVYEASKLKNLRLESDNFEIVEEMLILFCDTYKDTKVYELPVHFHQRDKGASKRNLLKFAISYLGGMWRLRSLLNKNKKGLS
jgi:dolichol-phosphate mannosyltransferase